MYNCVIISGRIGKKPELQSVGGGRYKVVTFSISTTNHKKDKVTGRIGTTWVDLQAWGDAAESICKYFDKGDPIEIMGHLDKSDYTDKEGNKHVKKYVAIDRFNFPMTRKTVERKDDAPADDFFNVESDGDEEFVPADGSQDGEFLPFG